VAFDLIIFDCDGVLVDSEMISCHAHADTLTRHGYPITPGQVLQRFLGVSDREARLMIETETGQELPDDFEAEVKAATLQFYEGLKPIAHVAEAVRAIALLRCVASSGTPEKIRHGLSCAGLYDLFAPDIFSATQVERGKPAPDLFLFAAERMKVLPARCLVIEDSGRDRGPRRRNDRARLSRRQPLRVGPCRNPSRRGRRRNLRRYAAIARPDRAESPPSRWIFSRLAYI
jgi:HAD superfamily hydrolase (TIGR01509 family)